LETLDANVTLIPGSTLVRDLKKNAAGSVKAYRYWVGLTPDCPLGDISCEVSFPKTNDDLLARAGESRTQRIARVGAITLVDFTRLRRIQEKLPRLVIRQKSANSSGLGAFAPGRPTDSVVPKFNGELVEIPTEAEVQECRDTNAPTREYIYREGDEPAAKYMFMVLCEDQTRGQQGYEAPETMDKTGIVWPEPATVDELIGS
jgi:hypothetical protein